MDFESFLARQTSRMTRRYSKFINPVFLVGDILILNLSLLISSYLKFGNSTAIYDEPYLTLVFVANIAWLLLELVFNAYEVSRVSRVAKVIRGIIVFLILHLLIVTGFWAFQKAYYYSREFLVYLYFSLFILYPLWRASFIYALRLFRKKGFNFRNVIIFGYGEVAEELRKYFLF